MSFGMAAFAQAQLVAADDVSAGCDVDFYNQLQASSTLKATQEMEAAQAIILKPDSVLQYTCFQSRINTAASALPFKKDLADQMDVLAGEPIKAYLDANFDHALDGGHTAISASDPCAVMGLVWQSAKCHNFDIALFNDFSEMAKNDLRIFPQQCPNPAARTANIDGLILDSHRPAGAEGSAERVASYQDQLAKCGTPIPTGLKADYEIDEITRSLPEKMCAASGCHYDAESQSCVSN